jgi:hypothetical protein
MAKQPDRTATPKPKPVEIILDEAETDTLRRAPARSVLFERQCRMFRPSFPDGESASEAGVTGYN